MSIQALREALHPQRLLWCRLLLGLAAVATIVAGLLAMHSLNLASHHNEVVVAEHSEPAVSQPGAVIEHHEAGSAGIVNATHEPGSCGGGCSVEPILESCILALLVASVLVAGAATVSRMSAIRAALVRSVAAAASLIPAAPPSLYVLSVSRT